MTYSHCITPKAFLATTPLRRSLCSVLIAIGPLLAAPSVQADAKGLALWKRSVSHPQTHFFEYREVNHVGEVTRFRLMNGGRRELTMFQMTGTVEYFQMPASIPSEVGSRAFAQHLAQYRQTLERCPDAGVVLQPRIRELEDAMQRMQRGEVRHNGAWITRIAYQNILDNEAADKNEARRANERRRQADLDAARPVVPASSSAAVEYIRRSNENKRRRTELPQ